MRSSRWLPASSLAGALLVLAAGCSGDTGGGDGDGPTADFVEQEPNDSFLDRDAVGNAVTFGGVCGPSESDYFALYSSAGTLTVGLEWLEGASEDDLDLWVYDSEDDPLGDDALHPPGDSPAQVTVSVSSGMDLTIVVECYEVAFDVSYLGTITRP